MGSSDTDTQCLNITIINDDALEGDQIFALTLLLPTQDPSVVIIRNMTAIIITDNDG